MNVRLKHPLPAGTKISAVLPDEFVPRPTITGYCKRCKVTEADVRGGAVIVSPSGMVHHGSDYGESACGHDATEWWWPA